jgi:hypothetical protein
MVAGGLTAIVFVCTLVCWAIWSVVFFTFVSHYFLVTLTDSSSGADEAYFPKEGLIEWWWKPILCAWVFFFWAVPTSILLSPVAAFSPITYLVLWTALMWLIYPMSLSSVLYSGHWLVFVHRGVFSRMIQHFGAYIYVNLVTFALFILSVWLFIHGLSGNFVYAALAIVIGPASILLYARHWGRFAWLSLNFLPRQQKQPRSDRMTAKKRRALEMEDEIPTLDDPEPAQAPAEESIREGVPLTGSKGIQATPTSQPVSISVPPPPEPYDEWTDTRPYEVIDDPDLPPFPKPVAAGPIPVAKHAPPLPVVEEEDEWAPNKKPYGVSDEGASVEPALDVPMEEKPEIDKPLVMTKYYDERAKKEAKEKREAEEAKRTMPKQSRKTPPFHQALLVGVWSFMIYPSTILAWGNLAVFTLVEFLIMYALAIFWPKAQ